MKFPKQKRLVDNTILKQFRHGQCVICNHWGVDPCHIKSKGSGGPDADWNLLRMCRNCHTTQHKVGWFKFIEKHPILILIFMSKGWKADKVNKKLWHPNLGQPTVVDF